MDKSKAAVKIYDKIAAVYTETFEPTPEEERIILKFINALPQKPKILDVGCGSSIYFNLINQHEVDYTGIDLSEGMIKLARKLHPKGKFLIQDMRKMDFDNNSFDGIFCFFSLIHIPKDEVDNILKRFYKLLKKDGKLALAFQEGEGEVFETKPLLLKEKMFLSLFTKKEIKQRLSKAGFKIIKTDMRQPYNDKEWKYNKLFVLAGK